MKRCSFLVPVILDTWQYEVLLSRCKVQIPILGYYFDSMSIGIHLFLYRKVLLSYKGVYKNHAIFMAWQRDDMN